MTSWSQKEPHLCCPEHSVYSRCCGQGPAGGTCRPMKTTSLPPLMLLTYLQLVGTYLIRVRKSSRPVLACKAPLPVTEGNVSRFCVLPRSSFLWELSHFFTKCYASDHFLQALFPLSLTLAKPLKGKLQNHRPSGLGGSQRLKVVSSTLLPTTPSSLLPLRSLLKYSCQRIGQPLFKYL